jgi:hypothetical protein
MKITSKEQAIEEFIKTDPQRLKASGNLGSDLWTSNCSKAVFCGVDFEFIREPEPLLMYTGKELYDRIEVPRGLIVDVEAGAQALHVLLPKYLEAVRDNVLARRAEMLRAMGSEELVKRVEDAICSKKSLEITATSVISLITEHIEANRPELTDAECRYFETSAKLHYVARRAAEYRSPAKGGIDEIGHTELLRGLAELRAENERLKSELAAWRTEHACCGSVDELHKKQAKINELSDLLQAARGDQLEKSKKINSLLPKPVDDSDEYGILVQDGCVAFVARHETLDDCGCSSKRWSIRVSITSILPPRPIDPTRIFKVTSQPRGPLKVPCNGEMRDDLKEQEKELGELSSDYDAGFITGAGYAIDWIKKANGAE